ncbi:hypothetical protein [Achromobacter sp.]|uniref:hypothetical protein n=1 Tax=Achromobacter sp. TaxID=134375 RepID=UPI0028A862DE|nr:hypothetical protein [Achromobacter sp.]
MADDPSRGEVVGAQAESSAAHTDARRRVFFMIGSCQPHGPDEKRHSTSVVWTKLPDKELARFQILRRAQRQGIVWKSVHEPRGSL